MAMLISPDCNNRKSDAEPYCPNCGSLKAGKRKAGCLLGIGILILPFIFAWFTLRKDYPIKLKIISLRQTSSVVTGSFL